MRETKNQVMEEGKMHVSDLAERTDLDFVSDSQDVEYIDGLYNLHGDYDAFFVKIGEGEYTEVYGIEGIIPVLTKLVDRIV